MMSKSIRGLVETLRPRKGECLVMICLTGGLDGLWVWTKYMSFSALSRPCLLGTGVEDVGVDVRFGGRFYQCGLVY